MRTARDLSVIVALLFISCTTDRTRRGYLEENARRLYQTPPERVAIVIPGFGVTRLYDPEIGRYVWGTAHATLRTRFPDDLDLPLNDDLTRGRDRLVPRGYVGSRGPVNIGWQLTEALRKYGGYEPGVTVHPFHYDWRLSARDNAKELDALVKRAGAGSKVDIVTHSAGSLIALAYVKLLGGADNVENLVLIAPTQRGVIEAFRVMVRPERFLRREFGVETVVTWPFVAELMPEEGRFVVDEGGTLKDFDVWRIESWESIVPAASRPPFAASLARAREFRRALASTPMPDGVRVSVIAGDCVPTARRVLQRNDGSLAFYTSDLRENEQHLAATLFEPGDGTVPASSADTGQDTVLVCDGHQGIASDPTVHRTLIRLLRAAR